MATPYDTSTSPHQNPRSHRREHDARLTRSFVQVARTATRRALSKASRPHAQRHLRAALSALALAAHAEGQ